MKSTCMRIIILVAYPTDYTANEDGSAKETASTRDVVGGALSASTSQQSRRIGERDEKTA